MAVARNLGNLVLGVKRPEVSEVLINTMTGVLEQSPPIIGSVCFKLMLLCHSPDDFAALVRTKAGADFVSSLLASGVQAAAGGGAGVEAEMWDKFFEQLFGALRGSWSDTLALLGPGPGVPPHAGHVANLLLAFVANMGAALRDEFVVEVRQIAALGAFTDETMVAIRVALGL